MIDHIGKDNNGSQGDVLTEGEQVTETSDKESTTTTHCCFIPRYLYHLVASNASLIDT